MADTTREELVQIAAVAVAAIETIDFGSTGRFEGPGGPDVPNFILQEIRDERGRQEEKWGSQDHSLEWWLVILGEEYGEACKALLESPEGPLNG